MIGDIKMNVKAFCTRCGLFRDYILDIEPVNSEWHGIQYSYTKIVAYCDKCFEEVYVPFINDQNVMVAEQAFKEARSKHD